MPAPARAAFRDPELARALAGLGLGIDRPPNLAEWRDLLQSLELLCDHRQSELRQAHAVEGELKQAKEAAEAASCAKDVFLANMSHELRTPLSVMLGYVQVLLECRLEADHREMLDTVYRSGAQLLGIINDILDYCKLESGQFRIAPREVNLSELLDEICQPFAERAWSHGLELHLQVDPSLPEWVRGDDAKLRQVLGNLLANALKFTEHGSINVEARLLRPLGKDFDLYVGVTDTGIGISEEATQQLFQPFSQADGSSTRRFGGSGLGLVIAKRIVSQMGGEIGVDSRPGSGSKFWFTLTLTRASAPSSEDDGAARAATVSHKPCVLIAEDNQFNQALIRRVLDTLNCTVETVADGEAAVRAVLAGNFDVVLMDCQMPGLDGFAAAREIRAQEPGGHHTPIIAITASVTHGDRERCAEAGMDEYIAKPFSVAELRRRVEHWLGAPSVRIDDLPDAPAPSNATPPLNATPPAVEQQSALPMRVPRPSSPPSHPATLDVARLQSLVEESGSREIVDELAGIFVTDIRARLEALARELKDGEREELARGAHAIRGACANFGARRMAELASSLEHHAPTADEEALVRELQLLEAEYARVCVELRAFAPGPLSQTLPVPRLSNRPPP